MTASAAAQPLRVRRRDADGVAAIVLARPEAGNALDLEMARQLRATAQQLTADVAAGDVHAVFLSAEGKNFCVGGDLREFDAHADRIEAHVLEVADTTHEAVVLFDQLPVPVVAAFQGAVAGGGIGLLCVCDLVIAAESAKLRVAYTAVGLSPDCGTSYFLPRLIGVKRAMDLALTNRVLTAAEALEWGLVSRVVADADVAHVAADLARQITAQPLAMARAKQLITDGAGRTLAAQLDVEARSIAELAASPPSREALARFLGPRATT